MVTLTPIYRATHTHTHSDRKQMWVYDVVRAIVVCTRNAYETWQHTTNIENSKIINNKISSINNDANQRYRFHTTFCWMPFTHCIFLSISSTRYATYMNISTWNLAIYAENFQISNKFNEYVTIHIKRDENKMLSYQIKVEFFHIGKKIKIKSDVMHWSHLHAYWCQEQHLTSSAWTKRKNQMTENNGVLISHSGPLSMSMSTLIKLIHVNCVGAGAEAK